MAADRSRLAAALAYRQAEEDRRRRMLESIPTPAGTTPAQPAPQADFRTNLENLSIGVGEGLTNQLEGIKGLVTDPIGTAKGVYEAGKAVVRDPAIIASALRQMGQKAMSGPLGAGEVMGEMIGPRKTGPVMAELDVYHGTPHRFPATEANPLGEFDASKIGTGEGAQAFGHGIYLAENPKIAEEYVKNPLNDVFLNERGEFLRQRLLQKQNDSQILNEYKEKYNETPEEAAKDFQSLKKLMNESASFYKADLPDEMIDRMLDYDKPLSEQPTAVRESLKRAGLTSYVDEMEKSYFSQLSPKANQLAQKMINGPDEMTIQFGKEFKNNKVAQKNWDELERLAPGVDHNLINDIRDWYQSKNGADLYTEMSRNGMQDASERLRQIGILGIKYRDAGSRGNKGDGTRNFVVFPGEEKKVRILERK